MARRLRPSIVDMFWTSKPSEDAGEFDMAGFKESMQGFDDELKGVYGKAKMSKTPDTIAQARLFLLSKWHDNGCKFMRRNLHPARHRTFIAEFVKQSQQGENFKTLAKYLGITEGDMIQLGARMRVTMKQD